MQNVSVRGKDVTVLEDGVLVKRNLTSKDGWIIGTIQIESIGSTRKVVQLVDEFPSKLPIDTVGFKSDQDLKIGDITPHRVSIKQPVEDNTITVDYGIKLSEDIEEIQFDPPTIRAVETAELARSDVVHTDGGDPSSGSSKGNENPQSPTASYNQSGETPPTQSTQTEPVEWGDNVASSSGVKGAIRKNRSEENNTESGEDESTDTESKDQTEPQRDVPTDTAVDEPRPDSNPTEQTDTGPSSERDELDTNITNKNKTNPNSRRSVEARIDWLSARVDEFAAYATALEELIDDHGTAPEFINRVEGDLADLEGQLQSVQEEINSVEEAHSTATEDLHQKTDDLDQRLDETRNAFETEIDDINESVSDELQHLESDIEGQRTVAETNAEELDDIDNRVAGLERELAGVTETVSAVENQTEELKHEVQTMNTELNNLRSEVKELAEFRDSLSNVFKHPTNVDHQSEQ